VKRFKTILFVLLALVLVPSLALAGVWVKNDDSTSYRLRIECGGSATETTLNSATTTTLTLPGMSGCKIIIKENGNKTPAKDGDEYIIKGGKFQKK
jgi:hypothetical protein